MESIETGYLLELQFLLESSIDMQFQAWMAITFAVIVASYSAGDKLSSGVKMTFAVVYLMAVYALFARWATEATRLVQIIPILAERGVETTPVWFSGIARLATYIMGTLIATIAIFYFGPNAKLKDIGSKEKGEGEKVEANSLIA